MTKKKATTKTAQGVAELPGVVSGTSQWRAAAGKAVKPEMSVYHANVLAVARAALGGSRDWPDRASAAAIVCYAQAVVDQVLALPEPEALKAVEPLAFSVEWKAGPTKPTRRSSAPERRQRARADA